MQILLQAKIEPISTTPDINVHLRYSFAPQFLQGSAIFARRAHEIENYNIDAVDEEMRAEHLSCVSSAVIQCAAALDAEIYDVTHHGPGNHLGSNDLDTTARDSLIPFKDEIDKRPTLDSYERVLSLLQKGPIKGTHIYESADLLIVLRNELAHYKSMWGLDMDSEKRFVILLSRLRRLKLEKPPFISPEPQTNFFPLICLSASLASWCVKTSVAYIDEFYARLNIISRLKPYEKRLTVPSPKKITSGP